NLAPFRNWDHDEALWETLILTPYQRPSWSQGFQDWDMAGSAVEQTPGFDLPSTVQLCGLLLVYIAVIGPINYVVLRALRRRELAWITIPGLVVLFSVLAYMTGSSLRGTLATLNSLNVVQVWPESDRAQVDTLLGVLSPRRTSYEMTMQQGVTVRPLPQDAFGTPNTGFGAVQVSTQITEGASFAAEDFLVDASFVAGFVGTGFIDDAPHVEGTARLSYGTGTSARVAGSVTNTTGMRIEEAVLLVRGGFQHVGALEPGESVSFDLPLTTRQSAPLSLAGGDPLYNYGGLDLTVHDVLGPNYSGSNFYGFIQGSTPTLQERLYRQWQDFLYAITPDFDLSGGRGDRVYLLGWTRETPLEITLAGTNWIPEDTTLYVFAVPVTVERPTEPVTISPGFSTWIAGSNTSAISPRPYDLTLASGEEAIFRFTPLPSAQLADVQHIDLTARRGSGANALISIWDWQAEEWIAVDLALGPRARFEDPVRFVGPENAVQVRVMPDINTPGTFVNYQQIDVTWYGTF
ncbi:MAG: hypothetical protein JW910_23675, partial [Anaerolineae bacterium]|nr:hypothetical protein [Anaerolineae bacterium]